MTLQTILSAICVLFYLSMAGDEPTITEYTTPYQWTTVDFDWDNSIPMSQSDAEESGLYIMENNIITGLKFYKNRTFLTVPRWRPGVPSTLNELKLVNHKPVLSPYPSWNMQTPNNCSALQYTQSMEIDIDAGKMWIVDSGYKYFFDDPDEYINTSYTVPDTTCPPKIV
eukprot:CAMPEP_0201587170 /NCGR_PEP_ID=MMETSP0190_2-20130828/141068_1 /ASSEMBLY_ACC=CAM_ASM_000263 /TAXON_ID=37353 /ORGANISM="Rosalina sp." /LENGTH=168 /DNA_ID=CAMNT_0048036693 /DNA_START=8 /DNA_END=510 /DNA_ORIENTATION=+